MREFYRTYSDTPEVLKEAMTIGWTQNIAVLKNGESSTERAWYI